MLQVTQKRKAIVGTSCCRNTCSHSLCHSGHRLSGAADVPDTLFGVVLQALELFAWIQRKEAECL